MGGVQTYGASKHMEGIQTYRWPSKHMGAYKRHPNIQGPSKHMEAYRCIVGIWTPLSLRKHAFFVVYMYSRHPHIPQTYRGGIQTYGGVQTYGGYQNIQGHPNMWGVSKHGPIQTYRGHPNIWGTSKCIGAYEHPLSLTRHTFFVLCMYRGHPNIIKTSWGHPNMWGCPNIGGHPNI